MKGMVTIMGCGNSTGVPAAGNYWGQCDPDEPKNERLRPSALIEYGDTKVVIDTGPDFRHQLNNNNIDNFDAVFYTHAHGDHVHGIDDLRVISFRNKKKIPVYSNQETLRELETRFHYLFSGGDMDIYPPLLEPCVIEGFGSPGKIKNLDFIPFEQNHGTCTTVGYRFGDFAYSTDMLRLDENAINSLKGIKTWVVDGAGYKDATNKVHADLGYIYEVNKEIGAKQVYLTSLTLAMDYQTMLDEFHEGYAPAFDGLQISVTF